MEMRALGRMGPRTVSPELSALVEAADHVATRRPDCSFSVIVPTWNEERWLPTLLGKLERQPSIAEVIIADNSSSDDTVKIALDANCRITSGGRPAAGRNAGAMAATEDIFLFIDADVAISQDVLDSLNEQFSRPGTELVYFRIVPDTDRLYVKAAYRAADFYVLVGRLFGRPLGSAPLICVSRMAFSKVGGFDEAMGAAEDVDFIRRVSRHVGGVRYVRSTPLHASARRFDLEGALGYSLKCVVWGLLRLVGLRVSLMSYKWERYPGNG